MDGLSPNDVNNNNSENLDQIKQVDNQPEELRDETFDDNPTQDNGDFEKEDGKKQKKAQKEKILYTKRTDAEIIGLYLVFANLSFHHFSRKLFEIKNCRNHSCRKVF